MCCLDKIVSSKQLAVSRSKKEGDVSRKLIFGVIGLFLSFMLVSCTGMRTYDTVRVNTDRIAIDILKNKSDAIKSINGELTLIPSTFKVPSIDSFMSYNNAGIFRLAGLTPNGFTLFDFETQDDHFTMSLTNRLKISGDLNDFRNGFKAIAGSELPVDPDIIRETIDFYGINKDEEAVFFIEEFRDTYILNQLKSDGSISYPVRRWWIDRYDKKILRKEVFSRNPEKRGEIIMEAEYRDFRLTDDIWTPYEILIREGRGKKLLKMKFSKVDYNK